MLCTAKHSEVNTFTPRNANNVEVEDYGIVIEFPIEYDSEDLVASKKYSICVDSFPLNNVQCEMKSVATCGPGFDLFLPNKETAIDINAINFKYKCYN